MSPFFLSIVENVFNPEVVRAAAEEWPKPDWSGWHAKYGDSYHKKQACNNWEAIPGPAK